MDKTIIGVFAEPHDAEEAISELESRHYNPKDISIIMKERDENKKVAEKTGANVGAGTVSGAATGGVIGALAGLLVAAGVATGIGALFIGGPLVAAMGLSGAAATAASGAATGALAGGIIGALGGLGVSGKDAAEYGESIKQGGVFVAVPARAGEENEVRSIFSEHGADKIRVVENAKSRHHSVGATRSEYRADDESEHHSEHERSEHRPVGV